MHEVQGFRVIDWLYSDRDRLTVPVSKAAKRIAGKYRQTITRAEMTGYVFEDSPHNFPRMMRRLRVTIG